MTYRIVTNNRLLHTQSSSCYTVDMVSGDAQDVFNVVEEALQNHWKLLTSPLPPNVPLIRSPIRTLVLQSSSERYDVPGLHCLAKGAERTASLAKSHRVEQRGDLEYIDRTFAQRALMELGLPFNDDRLTAAATVRTAAATARPAAAEGMPVAALAEQTPPPSAQFFAPSASQFPNLTASQFPPLSAALPLHAEIRGVDREDVDSALHYLWKRGIYAESGMGGAGLVVRLSAENCAAAKEMLFKAGYI